MPYYQTHGSNRGYINFKCEQLKNSFYKEVTALDVTAYVTKEPVTFENRKTGEYKHLNTGDKWGDIWDCGWFNFTADIPTEALSDTLYLYIDLNGEACVFSNEGCPLKGLTTNNSRMVPTLGNVGKNIYELNSNDIKDGKLDIWAEAGCNDLFGEVNGYVNKAVIATRSEILREFYYDFAVLNDLLNVLNPNSARFNKILNGLTNAALIIKDFTEKEALTASKIIKPLIEQKSGQDDFSITAIGHAHLDLCWTWPLRETIRKASRTFSTALYHLERYPEYIFGASQIQLYKWMEDRYPELFSKIKAAVKGGRWEVQGGMWCESDLNITGGESLVRQFLYGLKYAKEKLDTEASVCWLPDTFGYTGALPQIMKKSGIEYFCIQKIKTNVAFRKYPHDSFVWEGIDGSRVLVSVPPVIYGCGATPACVYQTETEYKDKLTTDSALMLFGQGDGGGGAGAEHLECLKREKSLNGLTPVIQDTALNYFNKLNTHRADLKVWTGSMDLDRHTGTLTSSAMSKYYNQLLENSLRDLELLAVIDFLKNKTAYPYKKIEELWQNVLLYQFHDILTGTSINRVFKESHEHYRKMLMEINEMSDSICNRVAVSDNSCFLNLSQFARNEWIKCGEVWKKAVAAPYSSGKLKEESFTSPSADFNTLENDLIKIEFNEKGNLISIYDKAVNREILCGESNTLTVYIDNVENGTDPWAIGSSAWDYTDNYRYKVKGEFVLTDKKSFVDGPIAGFEMTYTYGKSKLFQKVIIRENSRVIDFVTSCDWNEEAKNLRTNFKVNSTSDFMTRGIQFGNIKESLNSNTEWDSFRSDVATHKYADISDNDYGLSILTGYKYGVQPMKGELDLSLLRSPNYPAKDLDKGHHEFTYYLYPHIGDFKAGDTLKESYIRTGDIKTGLNIDMKSLFDPENVIIESVKLAENGDGIVIRAYEPLGNNAEVKIGLGFDVLSAFTADLTEKKLNDLKIKNNIISYKATPFEIMTFIVKVR